MARKARQGPVPPEMRNFGKTLALLREFRGLKQAEVARAAGVGKSQISKYEGGKELPKLASMLKLLEGMGYTYYELFATLKLVDEQEMALKEGAARGPSAFPGFGNLNESFAKVTAELFALSQEVAKALLLADRRLNESQEPPR